MRLTQTVGGLGAVVAVLAAITAVQMVLIAATVAWVRALAGRGRSLPHVGSRRSAG